MGFVFEASAVMAGVGTLGTGMGARPLAWKLGSWRCDRGRIGNENRGSAPLASELAWLVWLLA